MYKLYRVGDRTEPYGTPACMYLGVDISSSIETLNFHCERKELISLIKLVEKFNLDNFDPCLEAGPKCKHCLQQYMLRLLVTMESPVYRAVT
jgi:hypothetical protein